MLVLNVERCYFYYKTKGKIQQIVPFVIPFSINGWDFLLIGVIYGTVYFNSALHEGKLNLTFWFIVDVNI